MSDLTPRFIADFQRETEKVWSRAIIDPQIHGFQFQRGTRWLPGLSDAQITLYETAVEAKFPEDFRRLLRAMNGTDLPRLIGAGSEYNPKESVGVYSYPRDLHCVQAGISILVEDREGIAAELLDQGFTLRHEARLVPIFGHRYVVCDSDARSCVVLSIYGTDAIIYGDTLRTYLEHEFLRVGTST